MNNLFAKRFKELEDQMKKVSTSAYQKKIGISSCNLVNDELFAEWKVKVKNLIAKVCGTSSEHYQELINMSSGGSYRNSRGNFNGVKSAFLAAKEDYEGGYLSSMRTLVQAEVFSNELEQAEELLKNGYCTAAAVIAGTVLETGIRELCTRAGLDHGKLDKTNADLAKASVYNSLQQKKITALAAVRNSAAHGKVDEFTKDDVKSMIRDIEQFLLNYLQD